MGEDWTARFPALDALAPAVRETLRSRSTVVTLPLGARVFGTGSKAENLLLLLEGTVRVQQLSAEGREIVLYRIHAGDSCVLTTACLLADESYAAEGIAETRAVAAVIPRAVFDELVATSPEFRRFVFRAYARRIAELFVTIEEIAFRRLDIRLAQKLLDLAPAGDRLRITHARLAAELGTAREVISRQLGEFQRRGWVGLARGEIALRDRAALAALAATP
jgi:CRP/FNR family transcriptional regulator